MKKFCVPVGIITSGWIEVEAVDEMDALRKTELLNLEVQQLQDVGTYTEIYPEEISLIGSDDLVNDDDDEECEEDEEDGEPTIH